MYTPTHINLFKELFIHRGDVYAQQFYFAPSAERGEQKGYFTVCQLGPRQSCGKGNGGPCGSKCPDFQRQTVTDEVISDHLNGVKTIGAYLIDPEDSTVRLQVFDFDATEGTALDDLQEPVRRLKDSLSKLGFQAAISRSGSKGFHVWAFAAEPVQASQVMVLAKIALRDAGLVVGNNRNDQGRGFRIEVFPPQAYVAPGSFGNLIKLPLGVHQKTKERCLFVDDEFQPIDDQFAFLNHIGRFSANHLQEVISKHNNGDNDAGSKATAVPKSMPVAKMSFTKPPAAGKLEHHNRRSLPCRQAVWSLGVPEGQRDDAAFVLAMDLRDENRDPQQALSDLSRWNQKNRPPLPYSQVLKVVESVNTKGYEGLGCDRLASFCNKEGCPLYVQGCATVPNEATLAGVHNAIARASVIPGDVVEIVLATSLAEHLPKPKTMKSVWVMIVGDPSTGKTEIACAISANTEYVHYIDKATANAISSGYVDPKTNRPVEQFLTKVDGKCVIIKDLCTTLSGRSDDVNVILGDLLVAYDGKLTKETGMGVEAAGEGQFSLIACIPPAPFAQHQRKLSKIGSRFLIYQVPSLTHAERLEGFNKDPHAWDEVRQLVAALHRQLMEQTLPEVVIGEDMRRQIQGLALFISCVRSTFVKVKDNIGPDNRPQYETIRPQIEAPYRVFNQLVQLAQGLAIVHNRTEVTLHEIEVLRRVALSCGPAQSFDLLRAFEGSDGRMLTAHQIAQQVVANGGCFRSVERHLDDLVALGILEGKGQGKFYYSPKPDYAWILLTPWTKLDHLADLGT